MSILLRSPSKRNSHVCDENCGFLPCPRLDAASGGPMPSTQRLLSSVCNLCVSFSYRLKLNCDAF